MENGRLTASLDARNGRLCPDRGPSLPAAVGTVEVDGNRLKCRTIRALLGQSDDHFALTLKRKSFVGFKLYRQLNATQLEAALKHLRATEWNHFSASFQAWKQAVQIGQNTIARAEKKHHAKNKQLKRRCFARWECFASTTKELKRASVWVSERKLRRVGSMTLARWRDLAVASHKTRRRRVRRVTEATLYQWMRNAAIREWTRRGQNKRTRSWLGLTFQALKRNVLDNKKNRRLGSVFGILRQSRLRRGFRTWVILLRGFERRQHTQRIHLNAWKELIVFNVMVLGHKLRVQDRHKQTAFARWERFVRRSKLMRLKEETIRSIHRRGMVLVSWSRWETHLAALRHYREVLQYKAFTQLAHYAKFKRVRKEQYRLAHTYVRQGMARRAFESWKVCAREIKRQRKLFLRNREFEMMCERHVERVKRRGIWRWKQFVSHRREHMSMAISHWTRVSARRFWRQWTEFTKLQRAQRACLTKINLSATRRFGSIALQRMRIRLLAYPRAEERFQRQNRKLLLCSMFLWKAHHRLCGVFQRLTDMVDHRVLKNGFRTLTRRVRLAVLEDQRHVLERSTLLSGRMRVWAKWRRAFKTHRTRVEKVLQIARRSILRHGMHQIVEYCVQRHQRRMSIQNSMDHMLKFRERKTKREFLNLWVAKCEKRHKVHQFALRNRNATILSSFQGWVDRCVVKKQGRERVRVLQETLRKRKVQRVFNGLRAEWFANRQVEVAAKGVLLIGDQDAS